MKLPYCKAKVWRGFDECIHVCNHHHNQDLENYHYTKKLPTRERAVLRLLLLLFFLLLFSCSFICLCDWLVGWFELGKGEVRVKKIYDHSLLFWIKGHRWNHAFVQRQWQPTPVLLPGKSHGLRSLVGCSPWGRKESDMTEQLHFHFSRSCIGEGNGNPLQCSCLENPRDRGAWWAAFYGVAQSRTWLKQLSSSSSS